jgi:hypothetical protein
VAGNFNVNFDTPMEDSDYTIQLTVQGDYRIWVENQTTNNCTVRIIDNTTGAGSIAVFFITIID